MKDVYTRMIGECMIDAAALLHTVARIAVGTRKADGRARLKE